MRTEIEDIKNLISKTRMRLTEVENRLQALESESEPERRLWNVDKICEFVEGHAGFLELGKLEIVADYCNERDKKNLNWYYPIWSVNQKKVVFYSASSSVFPCPSFNSNETLERLISKNTEFFEQLLKPKE